MKKLLQISLALATAFGAFGAQAQDVKAGEKKIAMCIGCHGIPGYQASFPEIHKVPMIAGQNAKYIVAALQAYAKGDRKHPTMRGIAGSLSEQDMADVAAFYEQQAKLPAAPESIPAAPANVAAISSGAAAIPESIFFMYAPPFGISGSASRLRPLRDPAGLDVVDDLERRTLDAKLRQVQHAVGAEADRGHVAEA